MKKKERAKFGRRYPPLASSRRGRRAAGELYGFEWGLSSNCKMCVRVTNAEYYPDFSIYGVIMSSNCTIKAPKETFKTRWKCDKSATGINESSTHVSVSAWFPDVWMTGLEPATSWSLTRCATNCATSRRLDRKCTAFFINCQIF